jgi:hypothetical protein
MLSPDDLAKQEAQFALAFGAGDVEIARSLYHPEVIYLSPTVRLFDRPSRIEGIDATLEFVALTIESCQDIRYEAVEQACLPDGTSGFVRVHFDWTIGTQRLRSNYVVLYRYRDRLIARQELYYDPSGALEVLARDA